MSYTDWSKAAGGMLYVATDFNVSVTGGSTYDAVTSAQWTTGYLSRFTQASGVLTYTGPGEHVRFMFIGTAIVTGTNRPMYFGWSVGAAPGAAPSRPLVAQIVTTPYGVPKAYYDADLTTGTILRVKCMATGTSDTLTVYAGTTIIIN